MGDYASQLRVGLTFRDLISHSPLTRASTSTSRPTTLTHLHTDHAGGLFHVTGSRAWVSRGEMNRASGRGARVQGYLPHRWPKWWQPEFIRFDRRPLGPFDETMPLTRRADVLIVPTPEKM